MNELRVEYVAIESITPYINNAKQHPPEQIEQIKQSIKEFGFNDPIAVWHDEIVEGHGRLYAAQELGIKKVPIIRLDDLTDEQRRAYALVHNKITANTGFDMALLMQELASILSLDMADYGFQTKENIEKDLAEFFGGEDERTEKGEKERVKFVIKAGDKTEEVIEFLDMIGAEYEER